MCTIQVFGEARFVMALQRPATMRRGSYFAYHLNVTRNLLFKEIINWTADEIATSVKGHT